MVFDLHSNDPLKGITKFVWRVRTVVDSLKDREFLLSRLFVFLVSEGVIYRYLLSLKDTVIYVREPTISLIIPIVCVLR